MRLQLISYTNDASGLGPILHELRDQGYGKDYFQNKIYGDSITEMLIGMICIESFHEVDAPYLHGKQVSLDFKFDHGDFTDASHEEKKRIVGKRLNDGLRRVLQRMELPADFKLDEFLKDNKRFLRMHGWID